MTALNPMGEGEPMGERPGRGHPRDFLRCTAPNRLGDRCGKPAVAGTVVCKHHGGAIPSVVAKAKQRLLEAADPAAARLVTLLASDDEKIALAAAKDLLDRAGLGARIALDLGGIVPPPQERAELDADQAIAQAMALMDELALARQRRAERMGLPGPDDEIVDAEIVSED